MENIGKKIKGKSAFRLDLTEEFYLNLIKLSLDAIVIHKGGKILFINPAGIKMIRARKASDLIGKPLMRFVHPDYRALVKRRIKERLMRGKMAKPVEQKFIRFDKTILDVEVTSLPFLYKGGYAILSVVRDLTRQKETTEELSKLAAIVRSSDEAILSLTLDGIVLSFNKGAERLYGFKAWEMVGKSIFIIVPPNRKEELEKILEMIKQGRRIKHLQTQWMTKNRNLVDVSLTISPIKDISGRTTDVSIIARNITERKKEIQELSKLANVAENTADGVFMTNRAGIIQYVNPAFEKMTGYSKAEAIGQTPRIIKSGQHDKFFYHKLWRTILSGRTFRSTMINKRKNGELFTIDHTITPIKDNSQDIVNFVGIWKDITAQRDLEKRKDDFISMASHELKTPLTSISLYSQALSNILAQNGDTDYIRYLGKIEAQVKKLTDLTNNLLDISRIQSGMLVVNKEATNLNYLIKEVAEMMQFTSRKHKIIMEGKIIDKVYCDKERIGQVMINLLSNAIKYSPAGGDIVIGLSNGDKQLTVSVKDRGIGVPKKYQPRIFERFFRAGISKYASYPGMGIGLYLSSEIIKQHHGKMWVKSEDQKGSSFSFSIPIG